MNNPQLGPEAQTASLIRAISSPTHRIDLLNEVDWRNKMALRALVSVLLGAWYDDALQLMQLSVESNGAGLITTSYNNDATALRSRRLRLWPPSGEIPLTRFVLRNLDLGNTPLTLKSGHTRSNWGERPLFWVLTAISYPGSFGMRLSCNQPSA